MVDDEEDTARFQCVEKRPVERSDVDRSQKGIVQIVVILSLQRRSSFSGMRKFASEPARTVTFV